jgi:two-component system chemotaxis sensor kinase CheA
MDAATDADIISKLVPGFLSHTHELLAEVERDLLKLESCRNGDADAEIVNALFRTAHNVKGASWMMGYQAVGDVGHALEDVLGALRDKRLVVEAPLIDELLRTVDQLRRLVDQPPDTSEGVATMIGRLRRLLSAHEEGPAGSNADEGLPAESPPECAPSAEHEPAPTTVAQPEADLPRGVEPAAVEPAPALPAADDTVRVAVSRLDELARLAGELMMDGQRAQELDRRSLGLALEVRHFLRAIAASSSSTAPVSCGNAGSQMEALREAARCMLERVDAWQADCGDDTRLIVSTAERLEEEVRALRLLPIGTAFAGLPRLVRDLARAHGKQVNLVVEGESTELDRRILQGLQEPLLHLIRNAVDHGIETPAARAQTHKSPTGRVSVRASRHGGHVRIEVGDDGRGMSPQRLRDAAVRKKLITVAEAAALGDGAALDLIYRPGFSSSTLVTTTSGRGVGMEIVKTSVNKLGGSVEIWTEPNQGTRFTLTMPIALTLTRALLVEANGQTYALPIGAVERIQCLSPCAIQSSVGREHLIVDGESIPLVRLGSLLGHSTDEANDWPALIVSVSGQRAALAVERVLDEREVVLKPLAELLCRSTLVSAATLLADGTVVLVLDPAACVRGQHGRPQRATSASAPEASRQRRILVVEDTYTVRELERSMLVASGYEVETAVDGAQGLHKAETGSFDLVVTDIEMPRMNGFELTEALRADERLAALPVIIVTSVENEEEKRRGLTVGAQAYLVKSAFDQGELLETIERLAP